MAQFDLSPCGERTGHLKPLRSSWNSVEAGHGFIPRTLFALVQFIALWITATAVGRSDDREAWYVVKFDEKPVGFEQIRSSLTDDDRQPILSCYRKTELNLNRMGQNLTVRASLWTTQSVEGALKTFHLQRVDGSGKQIERSGTYNAAKGAFLVSERVTGRRREFLINTPQGTRSPILNLWLPHLAMTVKEHTTLPVFFPETASTSGITISPKQSGGQVAGKSGTRLNFHPEADPARLTALHIDANLNVVQEDKQFLGRTLSMRRTSPEIAMQAAANNLLDLDSRTLIPVDRVPLASELDGQLVLELRVTTGFLPLIPEATFQQVEQVNDSAVRITLSKPSLPNQSDQQRGLVDQTSLASTRWMPTEDPALKRLALMSAGADKDPAAICRKLESAVHTKMRYNAFSTSIVPANEVAKSLKGDCTEHAILLAALMRIKGIPSRLASGLIYTNQQFGFIGHVWVEARIENQWIPFDSAIGKGNLKATYVKLQHSEMPDTQTSGVLLFLPILELAGRTTIHVNSE